MNPQENVSTAAETRQLARSFAEMAEHVEAFYQLHCQDLREADRTALLAQAQQLDDLHDAFTASAIEATLHPLSDDLQRITAVTDMAGETLKRLKRLASVSRIAAAAAKLGAAIVTLDLGAIPQAVTDLATSSQEPETDGDRP